VFQRKISLGGLRNAFHFLIGTKKICLDGVWVSTDRKDVPLSVQRLLFKRTYEDQERELISEILTQESRVLEIGSGIGLISLIARKIATNGTVRSYEANLAMEPVIRKNYALNGLEPDLIMKAVSTDGKDLTFFLDKNVIASSAINRDEDHSETIVKSAKFNSILKEYCPDTVIIDVEGAEIFILDCKLLTSVKNLVVELHPHVVGQEKIDALLEKLEGFGFNIQRRIGKVALLVNKTA